MPGHVQPGRATAWRCILRPPEALTGLVGAQALDGQPDRAARLLGVADTVRRGAGAGTPPAETGDASRVTAATRRALDEATFAAEFRKGRQLNRERAASLLA